MAKSRPSKARKSPAKGGKKASKGKAKASVPKQKVAKAAKGAYEITCSECYSSFLFSGSKAREGDKITCPECLHNGQVAANEVMSKISSSKGGEAGKLMPAAICSIIFVVIAFAYAIGLTNPEGLSDTFNYGYLGVEALLLVAAIFFGVGYEKSRSEVYF